MIKRIKKPLSRLTIIVILILLFLIGGASIAVYIAPRSVPYVSAQVTAPLERMFPDLIFELQDTTVAWEDTLVIRFHSLAVYERETSNLVVRLPDIKAYPDLFSWVTGKPRLKRVVIQHPKLDIHNVSETEEEPYNYDVEKLQRSYKQLINALNQLQYVEEELPLDTVVLEDLRILLHHRYQDIAWRVPFMSVDLRKESKKVYFNTFIRSKFREENTILEFQGSLGADRSLSLVSSYSNLPTSIVADIMPDQNWLYDADIRVEGDASLFINNQGILKRAAFSVRGAQDAVAKKKQPNFDMRGKVELFNNIEIEGAGIVPKIELHATIDAFPMNDLSRYWPPGLVQDTRDWVVPHIRGGTYDKAEISLDLRPYHFIYNSLTDNAIQAQLTFHDGIVSVHEDLPAIEKAAGTAKFNFHTVEVNVEKGQTGDTVLDEGQVTIYDIDRIDQYIVIEGAASGPAKDLFRYYQLTNFRDEDTPFYQNHTHGGHADSQFSIEFMLAKEVDINAMKIRALSDVQNLELYNVDLLPWIKAEGYVNATLDYDKDIEEQITHVSLEASHTTLNAPLLEWYKEANTPLSVSLKLVETLETSFVDQLKVKGDNVLLSGTGLYDNATKRFSLSLQEGNILNNNIFLRIDTDTKATNFEAKLDRLNAVAMMNTFLEESGTLEDKHYHMDAQVGMLKLKNGMSYNNVDMALDCNAHTCHNVALTMGEENDKVSITTAKEKQINRMQLHSNDAGKLLNSLDISNNMNGGVMEASMDASTDKLAFSNGKLLAKDFLLVKAPFLAKLLSLASLTGVVDLLNGNGIRFEKMKGEFALTDNSLYLNNIKAHGNALGITANGTANLKDKTAIIEGVVIPSYTLNNLLENVPLIGNLLVAGDSEGVIATGYKVKGDIKNPDISVNPLTMLTPGFLRNIWGSDEQQLPQADTESTTE